MGHTAKTLAWEMGTFKWTCMHYVLSTLLHMTIDCRSILRQKLTTKYFKTSIPNSMFAYRSLGLQRTLEWRSFPELTLIQNKSKACCTVLGNTQYIYFYCSSTSTFACRKWPSALSPLAPTTSKLHLRKFLKSWPVCFCQFRLTNALSSAKNSSIGFRSGEYGGRYNNLTPAFEHNSLIWSVWWKDALSIIRTDFGSGHLPQWWRSCSIKSSNMLASVAPWKTRDIKMPSWQYAGRIWYRWPRWKRETWIGATPRGDQPVLLKPARLSQPDSSM